MIEVKSTDLHDSPGVLYSFMQNGIGNICGVVDWNTIIYALTNKKILKTCDLMNSRILKKRL